MGRTRKCGPVHGDSSVTRDNEKPPYPVPDDFRSGLFLPPVAWFQLVLRASQTVVVVSRARRRLQPVTLPHRGLLWLLVRMARIYPSQLSCRGAIQAGRAIRAHLLARALLLRDLSRDSLVAEQREKGRELEGGHTHPLPSSPRGKGGVSSPRPLPPRQAAPRPHDKLALQRPRFPSPSDPRGRLPRRRRYSPVRRPT